MESKKLGIAEGSVVDSLEKDPNASPSNGKNKLPRVPSFRLNAKEFEGTEDFDRAEAIIRLRQEQVKRRLASINEEDSSRESTPDRVRQELRAKLYAKDNTETDLRSELESILKQKESLEKQVARLTKQLEEKSIANAKVESDLTAFVRSDAILKGQIKNLEETNTELNNRLSKRDTDISNLRRELVAARAAQADSNDSYRNSSDGQTSQLIGQISQQKQMINSLRSEQAAFQQVKLELEDRLGIIQTEKNAAQKEIRKMRSDMDESLIKIENLERDLVQRQQQLEAERRRNEFDTSKSLFEAELAMRTENEKRLTEELNKTEEELLELSQKFDTERSSLKADALTARKAESKALAEKAASEDQRHFLQVEVERLQALVERMREKHDESSRKKEELGTKLQAAGSDYNLLKLEYGSARDALAASHAESERLTNELASEKSRFELLEKESKSKIEELSSKLDQIRARNFMVTTKAAQLEKAREEIATQFENFKNDSQVNTDLAAKHFEAEREAMTQQYRGLEETLAMERSVAAEVASAHDIEFKSLQKEISLHQDECEKLRKDIAEARQGIHLSQKELAQKLEAAEVNSFKLEREKVALEEKISLLHDSIAHLERDLHFEKDVNADLTQKIDNLKQDLGEMRRSEAEARLELEKCTSQQLQSLQADLKNLQLQLKDEESKWNAKLLEIDQQKKTLSAEKATALRDAEQLRHEIELLQLKVKGLETDVSSRKEATEQLRAQWDATKRDLNAQIAAYMESDSRLKSDIRRFELTIADLNENVKHLEDNVTKTKEELIVARQSEADTRAESDGNKERIDALSIEVKHLQNLLSSQSEITKQIEKLEQQIQNLHTEKAALRKDLQLSKTDLESARASIEAMERELAYEKHHHESLKQQLDAGVQNWESQLTALAETEAKLRNDLRKAEMSVRDLTSKNVELEKTSQSRLETVRQTLEDQLRQKNSDLDHQKETADNEIRRLSSDLEVIRRQWTEIKNINDENLHELEALKTSSTSQLSALRKETEVLSRKIKDLEAENEVLLVYKANDSMLLAEFTRFELAYDSFEQEINFALDGVNHSEGRGHSRRDRTVSESAKNITTELATYREKFGVLTCRLSSKQLIDPDEVDRRNRELEAQFRGQLEVSLKSKDDVIASLRDEQRKIIGENREYQSAISTLQLSLDTLESSYKSLQKDYAAKTNGSEFDRQLLLELCGILNVSSPDHLRSQVETNLQEIQRMKSHIFEEKQQRMVNDNEKSWLQNEVGDLQRQVTNLSSEKAEKQRELQSLRSQLDSSHSKDSVISGLRDEISQLVADNKDLLSTISSLKHAQATLENSHRALREDMATKDKSAEADRQLLSDLCISLNVPSLEHLRLQKDKVTQEVQRMKNSLFEEKQQRMVIENEKNWLQTQVGEFQRQVAAFTAEKSERQKQLDSSHSMDSIISGLRDEISQLVADNKDLLSTISSLKHAQATLENSYRALQEDLATKDKVTDASRQLLSDLCIALNVSVSEPLSIQLETSLQEVQRMKSHIFEEKQQRMVIENEKNWLQSEVGDLQRQISTLSSDKAEKQREAESARSHVEILNDLCIKFSVHNAIDLCIRLDRLQQDLQRSSTLLAEEKQQRLQLETDKSRLSTEKAELTRQVTSLTADKSEKQNELDIIKRQFDVLQGKDNEITTLRDKLKQSVTEKQNFQVTITSMQQSLVNMETSSKRLRDDIVARERAILADRKIIQDLCNRFQAQTPTELRVHLDNLVHELQKLNASHTEEKQQKRLIETENTRLLSENAELQRRVINLSMEVSDKQRSCDSMRMELASASASSFENSEIITSLRSELQSLLEENQEHQISLKSMKNSLLSCETFAQKLLDETDVRREVDKIADRSFNFELIDHFSALAPLDLRSLLERIAQKLLLLSENCAFELQQRNAFEDDNTRLYAENSSLQKQVAILTSQITDKQRELDAVNAVLVAEQEEFTNQIQALRLSLKVLDEERLQVSDSRRQMESKMLKLESELKHQLSSAGGFSDKCSQLQQANMRLESFVEELKRQVNHLQLEISDSNQRVYHLDHEKSVLQSNVSKLERERTSSTESWALEKSLLETTLQQAQGDLLKAQAADGKAIKLQDERRLLEAKCWQLEDQLASARSELQTLHVSHKSTAEELHKLRDELIRVNGAMWHKSVIDDVVVDHSQTLRKAILAVKDELARVLLQRETLEANVEQLKRDLKFQKGQLEAENRSKSSPSRRGSSCVVCGLEATDLHSRCVHLQHSLDSANDELRILKKQKLDLEGRLSEYEVSSLDRSKAIADYEALVSKSRNKLSKAEAAEIAARDEVVALKGRLSAVSSSLEVERDKRKELEHRLSFINTDKVQAQDTLAMKAKAEEAFREELRRAKADILQLKDSLRDATKSASDKDIRIHSLIAENKESSIRILTLSKENTSLKLTVEDLQSKNESMRISIRTNKDVLIDSSGNIERLEKEVTSLNRRLSELQRENDKLRDDLRTCRTETEVLQRQLQEKDQHFQRVSDYNAVLTNTIGELKHQDDNWVPGDRAVTPNPGDGRRNRSRSLGPGTDPRIRASTTPSNWTSLQNGEESNREIRYPQSQLKQPNLPSDHNGRDAMDWRERDVLRKRNLLESLEERSQRARAEADVRLRNAEQIAAESDVRSHELNNCMKAIKDVHRKIVANAKSQI